MPGQDIFDLLIVVTLVFFTLRGASNGFIAEVAGLFSILGGFWAAKAWHSQIAPYVSFVNDPGLRDITAFALAFLGAAIAVGLAARILKKIVAFSFAGWLDKLAGAAFGLCKGVLLWVLIFIALDKIFRDSPFLRDSRAAPYFASLVDQLKPLLPPGIVARIGL